MPWQVRLHRQPCRDGGGAGGCGGRRDAAEEVAIGDRQQTCGQRRPVRWHESRADRASGQAASLSSSRPLGETAPPVLGAARAASSSPRRRPERRLVVGGGLEAGIPLGCPPPPRSRSPRSACASSLVNRPTMATRDAERAASTAAVAPAPGAGMRAASCPRKSPIDWWSRSSRPLIDTLRASSPTAAFDPARHGPVAGERLAAAPAPQRVEHRDLPRVVQVRDGQDTLPQLSQLQQPARRLHARQKQPEGRRWRPPASAEPKGEVRRGRLGQLAVLVDENDVVGLRVPVAPASGRRRGAWSCAGATGRAASTGSSSSARRTRRVLTGGRASSSTSTCPLGQQDPHPGRFGAPLHGRAHGRQDPAAVEAGARRVGEPGPTG